MKAFIDSDILIWHLRGNHKALIFFQQMQTEKHFELCTGAMQRAEVVFFMRPEEATKTMLFLSQFTTTPIDEKIIDLAGMLYRKWNPSHGTDPNDAILAATVLEYGGQIFSLNKKHYPMPELFVSTAW
jgi:predicted nucleic acid-binding protein